MTAISSREFNQDTSAAKRAAMVGPVFITDRGRPAHVLMTFDDYNRLAARQTINDLLACPEAAGIDFDPTPMKNLITPAEFE